MAKYFKHIKSLDDLKAQFKTLAKANHPDAGGSAEVMKEINCEFDALFPIWKNRYNAQNPSAQSDETADAARTKFYTEFGWKGKNHDWKRSLKEVAQIVRAYVKEKYPTYKFSVRTSYASMCQELHVDLKESPVEIYKSFEEMTDSDKSFVRRRAENHFIFSLHSWTDSELKAEYERIWEQYGNFYRCLNDVTKSVIDDVDDFVRSYNYEDCDSQMDYHHVDFYYFGCAQNNGRDIKIVPKTPRIAKRSKTRKSEENLNFRMPEVNRNFSCLECSIEEKQKEEALKRMISLGITGRTINEFKDGTLNCSEQGMLCWLDLEEEMKISAWQKETGNLVYHVVKYDAVCSLLYVSPCEEEWRQDMIDLENGEPLVFCMNMSCSEFSEYYHIAIKPYFGGVAKVA